MKKQYKKNSSTLSKIITVLWDNPNNWVKSSNIKNMFDGNSINKQLSLLGPRGIAKDLGIKYKKNRGKDTEFRIQPSWKNFENALRLVKNQSYQFPFINSKGAKKLLEKRFVEIGLSKKDIDNIIIDRLVFSKSAFEIFTKKFKMLKKVSSMQSSGTAKDLIYEIFGACKVRDEFLDEDFIHNADHNFKYKILNVSKANKRVLNKSKIISKGSNPII